MGEAMRVASEQGKRFVVLDRPNPIGGDLVTGPMLDAGSESFVGYHAIPVRHGMTTGELALMMRDELKLNLDLHVVRCQGWRRRDTWDATNLMWINPSPNMRCLTQALLYPGIGLLETTNLSVGRGTDAPFEVIGAPWVEARALAANLNGISLPGVRFIPIEFTPNSSTFAGKLCQGVNIHITNRELLDPVAIGMAIMVELRRSYPDDWNTQQLNRLLNNKNVYQAVLDQQNWETVLELSQQGVEDFRLRREKYLLYE
jgi:uncharacterized protein YbbC (DUF1343 family)